MKNRGIFSVSMKVCFFNRTGMCLQQKSCGTAKPIGKDKEEEKDPCRKSSFKDSDVLFPVL